MADGSVTIDALLNTDKLKNGFSKIGNIAKGALKGVTVAVGTVATALVGATIAATKFGAEYETSLAKVSTLFGDVEVKTDVLTDKILKLSNATGLSATELNEGLYQALSAGVEVTEDMTTATDFLNTSVKLAKGGFTTTESAVDLLTTTLNAYKLGTKDANRVADILINTQNKGKTTIDELSKSMGRVIPTASAYNVNLENVSSSLAIMTASGINTAESTTYLKSMLNELAKDGSDVADTLESKTGKSFSDLMKEGKSLGDIMKILGDSVNNDATAFANLWSSQEAGTGALSILNSGTAKYNETLQGMKDSIGSTESAYNKMADTFETQSKRAKQGIKNLGIQMYEGLKPGLKEGLKVINGYIDQINTAFQEDGFEGAIDAIGKIAVDGLTRISEQLPQFIEMSTKIVQNLITGIQNNLPQIMQSAVQIVQTLLQGFLQMLPQILEMGINILVQLVQGITQMLPELIPMAVNCIITLVETLLDNLDLVIDARYKSYFSFNRAVYLTLYQIYLLNYQN